MTFKDGKVYLIREVDIFGRFSIVSQSGFMHYSDKKRRGRFPSKIEGFQVRHKTYLRHCQRDDPLNIRCLFVCIHTANEQLQNLSALPSKTTSPGEQLGDQIAP